MSWQQKLGWLLAGILLVQVPFWLLMWHITHTVGRP